MGGSSPFGDTASLGKICHPRALSGYVRGTTCRPNVFVKVLNFIGRK